MQQANKVIVPLSIIIAGGLIAFAIYSSGGAAPKAAPSGANAIGGMFDQQAPTIEVAPLSNADHVQGNRNAKLVIVEYSDTECPFCKRYHETLKQVTAEYGDKVAVAYRHFPLDMHEKAPKEAEASECAAELGGEDAFWKFIDIVYSETPSNDGLDHALLPSFAERAGVDKAAFKKCLDSGKYAAKIAEAKETGYKAGARGTPYTVFFLKNGSKTETIPLANSAGDSLGALPYASLKSVIDKLLNS